MIDIQELNITENGTYTAPAGVAYNPVNVNVPNTYAAGDEGKVVSGGALVAQSSDSVTQNGIVDTTLIDSLTVNVPVGISVDDLANNSAPSGAITLSDSITDVKEYAFAGKPITSIIAPKATVLHEFSLSNTLITDITDVNFPILGQNSEWSLLLRMNSLVNIKLTGKYIRLDSGTHALQDNPNLEKAEFPYAAHSTGSAKASVAMYAFANCPKLKIADLGYAKDLGGYVFNNDNQLETIVLRKSDALVTCGNATFNNCPFKNGGAGGTIYIPEVLYDHLGDGTALDYQSATNWSTIHGYGTITWAKIEGSIYET